MSKNMAKSQQSNRVEIVRNTVRKYDRDRYVATLFAPQSRQAELFSLYAFNAELSRISSTVSEPLLGEIKLQWWRDSLSDINNDEATGNPVSDAFVETSVTRNLPKHKIQELMDARTFDISGEVMPDRHALKVYLQKTEGNLFSIAGQILLGQNNPELDSAAEYAGRAYGLTAILRSLPVHIAQNKLFLPVRNSSENSIPMENLFSRKESDTLKVVLADFRTEVRDSLVQARTVITRLPIETRPAFKPLALVEPYLKALESPDHKPLKQMVEINPLLRFWKLWRG